MSKLTINLTFRTEFSVTPTVTSVEVLAGKTGTINYLNKIVTLTGESEVISIPAVTANTQYASVMLPQTIQNFVIKIGDENYYFNSSTSIVLESGKHHILNLTVGENGSIKLNSSIIDWEVETSIGEATTSHKI